MENTDKINGIDILVGDQQEKNTEEARSLVGKDERAEYIDLLQRLQADFNNYRKRAEKEKNELAAYVRGNMIQEFLPVLDDFERLLGANSEHDLKNGAQLIFNNFLSVLRRLGLKEFAANGEQFNPNIHEAMSVKESEPEFDGKIVATWQKGYWLGERLLRPAKVVVGRSN